MKVSEIFQKMNEYGEKQTPFLFLIDFKKEKGEIYPLNEIQNEILFEIESKTNSSHLNFILKKNPISFEDYKIKFDRVQQSFKTNEIELINLTAATPIEINLDLEEVFNCTQSKYKVLMRNEFVCFSPETFIKIKDGKIFSYPMKGTMDASIENAKEKLLSDAKEIAEHTTTVELIKKDLEKVSSNVRISKFRYVEEIQTHTGSLLQVSSEVYGKLEKDFKSKLGNIMDSLLPAGSICGFPKEESLKLIEEVEKYSRNYYTGIFGIFDGENLDSAVLIRFIEKTQDGFVFKSGGGVTAQSSAEKEYQELLDKVYVPIH